MAGEARRKRLRSLAASAGVRGVDVALLEDAFVHESAVRERLAARSNERLEFLGDAVLGFVVARWLFERYPAANEGELALRKASLVSDAALAQTALALEFEPLMTFGAGLAKSAPSRRRSALADAFEAWVAALYRAAGLDAAARFVIERHVVAREAELGATIDDPKTVLQEWTQRRYTRLPVYEERFDGPAHERVFSASVCVEGERLGEGEGPTKKAAQRAAAKAALDVLRERYDDVVPRALSSAVVPARAARKRAASVPAPARRDPSVPVVETELPEAPKPARRTRTRRAPRPLAEAAG